MAILEGKLKVLSDLECCQKDVFYIVMLRYLFASKSSFVVQPEWEKVIVPLPTLT